MSFFEIYFQGLGVVIVLMTVLWIVSVFIKNASIVDPFWGMGYFVSVLWYFMQTDGLSTRKILVVILVILWSLRLSIFLGWRNFGKGEDFRYQQFRKDYGEHRYWWLSFFQVFLLQGILLWIISAPLLAVQYYSSDSALNFIDYIAIAVWVIGFIFEAGGDYQMTSFKSNPENKGKVLNTGFWKYTRHPNYFGDATVWWAYGLFSLASGSYWPLIGSLIMTLLLLKVSGVSLLEKTLKETKPEYKDYILKTNAFIPWVPKK